MFPRALPVVGPRAPSQGPWARPISPMPPGTIASIETASNSSTAARADALVTNPIAKEVLQRAGLRPSRPYRISRRIGRTLLWPESAAGDAALVARARRRAGDDPCAAGERAATRHPRAADRDRRNRRRRFQAPFRPRGAAPRLRRAQSARRRRRRIWGARRSRSSRRRSPNCAKPASTRSGPYPADTLFHAAAREKYDVAICMYHDQALIPIKTLAFDSAVNVTLGLPFVRTSPDHGTAFDIAAEGKADPTSLIAALRLARGSSRKPQRVKDALPPLREVVAAHGLAAQKIARPEFSLRSQSHRRASPAPPGRSRTRRSSRSARVPAA